ncbi:MULTISPECIES: GNAT family N-acetyltransferase [Kitasatospora]|uniref:GNAT family N-acetyltransferase n=1 Tax=Kitasatospora TaxID=2063 RepID=UPI0031DA12EB
MPHLIAPDARFQASFLVAMAEFRALGHGGPDDGSTAGVCLREYGDRWEDPEVFAEFVERFRTPCGPDSLLRYDVPCSTFWYVDGDTYLARIAIRHRLTPYWLELGGHIGYDVRPSARRRGHATGMLRAALPIAAGMGIDPALVTCDSTNSASLKVIEACGGRLEDVRDGVRRYWVPTTPGRRG